MRPLARNARILTGGDVMTTHPPAAARFISVDGMDGAGKSSQIGPLVEWLRGTGRRVVTCRDPGSTAAGDAIRGILLDRHDVRLDANAEMLLYMAARAQLVAEVIRPALGRGDWVVSDRYLLANVVYQGHAGGLEPDLVLLLDVDLETATRRLSRPLDKLENRGDDYRRRLREGYRDEAARQPGRIALIDGTAGVDEVAARLREAVLARFAELR